MAPSQFILDYDAGPSLERTWSDIRNDAESMRREGPDASSSNSPASLLDMEDLEIAMSSALDRSILRWSCLEEALACHLADKLSFASVPAERWQRLLLPCFKNGTSSSGDPIRSLILRDLMAIKERDPACPSLGHAFLYFKGFHGVQIYRAANWLWRQGYRSMASLLQSRSSEVFGMDIHPAAQIGASVMVDHATGIVIGETARVGDGCTLLHAVTLGGNGKEHGDRHPKLGKNVLVGAGASILGNVNIGDSAKIGASAVVLNDIPSFATAVGCPAKVIGRAKEANPASSLDHSCKVVDVSTQPLRSRCAYRHLEPSKPGYLSPCYFVEVPTDKAMTLLFGLDTDYDGELPEEELEKYVGSVSGNVAGKTTNCVAA